MEEGSVVLAGVLRAVVPVMNQTFGLAARSLDVLNARSSHDHGEEAVTPNSAIICCGSVVGSLQAKFWHTPSGRGVGPEGGPLCEGWSSCGRAHAPAGNTNQKVAPWPGSLSTPISPPWASMR